MSSEFIWSHTQQYSSQCKMPPPQQYITIQPRGYRKSKLQSPWCLHQVHKPLGFFFFLLFWLSRRCLWTTVSCTYEPYIGVCWTVCKAADSCDGSSQWCDGRRTLSVSKLSLAWMNSDLWPLTCSLAPVQAWCGLCTARHFDQSHISSGTVSYRALIYMHTVTNCDGHTWVFTEMCCA